MAKELQSGVMRCIEVMRMLRERNIAFAIDCQSPEALLLSFPLGDRFVEIDCSDEETLHSIFEKRSESVATPVELKKLLVEFWRD